MFRFSRRQIGFLLVLALLLIPATALAGHQFTDAPNSNIFHNDISWLADKGITKGCNPPANTRFCPKNNVTREQMAAFMHRAEKQLGTRYGGAFETDTVLPNGTNNRIATTYMTAPSSGGAIIVTGRAGIADRGTFALGILWAELNNGGLCNDNNIVSIADLWDTDLTGSTTTDTWGAAPGVPAARHRIDLCAWHLGGSVDAAVAELGVTWIATGATGGTTLSGSGVETHDAVSGAFSVDDLKARIIASLDEQ